MHAPEDHREGMAWDVDALLHDVRARERREERLLPLVLVDRPAEHYALAAVLVVWLEHKSVTVRDDEVAEIDDLSRIRRVSLADLPGPGDVLGDRGALRRGVQGGVAIVRKQREGHLFLKELLAEHGHDRDGTLQEPLQ